MTRYTPQTENDNVKFHVILSIGMLSLASIAVPLMIFAEFANAIIAASRCDD